MAPSRTVSDLEIIKDSVLKCYRKRPPGQPRAYRRWQDTPHQCRHSQLVDHIALAAGCRSVKALSDAQYRTLGPSSSASRKSQHVGPDPKPVQLLECSYHVAGEAGER